MVTKNLDGVAKKWILGPYNPFFGFPVGARSAGRFRPCPCPLFSWCSGQNNRARARAKFEGKIHGEMNQRAKIDFALALFFP